MVLVSMLLIPLVCGLLDFGMLWQKNQSAETAVRQAARRAAANCLEALNDPSDTCKNGSQEEDDANALLSIVSALGSTNEIEKVVVFNADNSSVADLKGSAPAGCMEAAPPTGIDSKCNVYGPSELAGITSLDAAGLKARFNCSAFSASASWCPHHPDPFCRCSSLCGRRGHHKAPTHHRHVWIKRPGQDASDLPP